jgi:PAS domain S-box-containing protein
MGDGRTDCYLSAEEAAGLRRRVADLERANERLSEQLRARGPQRYEDLIENMNDIIYTADPAGNLLSVNRAVTRILGFDPQEVIGTHYSRWMPKEDFDKLEAARPGTLEGQRAVNQAVITDKQGRDHYVEISVSPLVVDGHVEGTQGIIRDITSQWQAEEEIRSLQRQTEFILSAAKTSLNITDQHRNLRFVDSNWRSSHGDYQGRKCYEYYRGRDHPCPECGIPQALALRQAVVHDGVVLREGDPPTEVTTIPFQAENGEWLVAEVCVDITERTCLERQLRESEERYRTVVENAGEAISIVDVHGAFLFLNATAAQALAGQPSDFVGKTMGELFPQEIAARQVQTIRRVIHTRKGENVIVPSSVRGQLRWYNTTIEPLRDSAGTVTAALVMARDIHELRTAQQELEIYREKMIRAEHLASLGTLSAMLAHQMTQPLTVIRLALQNALQSLEDASCGPTVLEDLRDALAGVANASGLVERFRDFAGQMSQGTTGEVSLPAAARRVIRLLDENARQARIALRVDLPDDLPSIRSYGNQIEQVLFLLAQNAIQAADGARDHCLCIRGVRQADAVELQFADDCGGIAPPILERVFEPFVTTKPPGEGTGLGLCVAQRLVSQVGGRLRVDSRWGEGTTFFLTLPIERK